MNATFYEFQVSCIYLRQPNMKKIILTILTLSLFSIHSYGGHVLGSEITYKKVDSLKYIVTVTKYRLCAGTSMGGSQDLLVSCTSSGSSSIKTLSRVAIQEVKLHCTSNGSECSPENTRINGSEGVERHIFRDTIDFSSSPFSTYENCSGNIRFAITECCRGSNINTGGANSRHYNYAELNLSMGNNSVDLTSDPKLLQACSQPVFYNLGAKDAIEHDSVSYSFEYPLTAAASVILYSGTNYAYDHPFEVYYPGSLAPPYCNANASTPIGICLDAATGDLTYTPTNCNEVTSWVLQVTEWRKDTSGTYQIVGKTRRDVITATSSLGPNNTPTINGPYSYNICEDNQLCFNITTGDASVTVSSTTISDTLLMSWNEGIPDASFTLVDSTARLKTGRFCWTPPSGSANSIPYTFTVEVNDNHCDISSKTYRTFSVQVKQNAETTVNVTDLNCGWYTISSQIDSSNFVGNPGYLWTILDSNSNTISDNSIAYFQSTGVAVSTLSTDSLKVQRAGKYIIQHTIRNTPLNCSQTYYDTINLGTLATTLIEFPKDTIICSGTDFTLNTTTTNASSTLHYQWYANGALLTDDTATSLSITNFNSDTAIGYKVIITDANGCTNSDQIIASPNTPYQDTLVSSIEACQGVSIFFSLDSSLQNILWSNGETTFNLEITQSINLGVQYIDSFGCAFSDNSIVDIKELPQPNLIDSVYCGSSASISPGNFAVYNWSTGSSASDITINTTGTYWVHVADSNGCQNRDTASFQFLNKLDVNLGSDTTHCGPLMLSTSAIGTYNWSTGSTTSSTLITQTGSYSLNVSDGTGCYSSDDINVVINSLPQQTWADTIEYCSNSLVTVTSDSFSSYRWNTGATTRSIQVGNGPYSITFTGDNNCENKDTIYVKLNAIPEFSLGADTTLCGTTLTLSASGGTSYIWNTGSTASFTNANSSGTYWLQRTDQNNCSYTDSLEVVLLTNPNTPTLTRANNIITSNQTGTHIWYKDGAPISGFTQNTLTINSIGTYTAVFIDSNGCSSDLSNTVQKTVGISDLDSDQISIYPNPSNGSATVQLHGLNIRNVKSIKLYNSQGKLLNTTVKINGEQIDLKWSSNSEILFLELETESSVYRKKIVNVR
ncbi:MAG: hypothetical protein COA58_07360 [Bacteroidetes bacterium]|nr:MAG: hypothetical protein COA58_07360 [Bacteroidota bacterium]